MERVVGRFEKISFEKQDLMLEEEYNSLKMPKRATRGSAGYDFFAPYDIELKPGESKIIPTGMRAFMHPHYVLKIYPRSGLGFKYKVRLNNTVGIIDSDYYYSDNEGHILIKLSNENLTETLKLNKGEAFAQGIILPFFLMEEEEVTATRNGGFGSTTNK